MGQARKYSCDTRQRVEFDFFFRRKCGWKIIWFCEFLNMQEYSTQLAKNEEVLGVFSRKDGKTFQTFCNMYKNIGIFAGVIHENARLSVEVLGIS